ncbi:hypothetical protein PG989_002099 [Apiospora arundinis]
MAPRRCTRVDSSSNSDDSDLDAADLDKALRVISPKVAQEIQDFRMSLGKIQTKQRIKRCQEKRDKLLDRSKDIEIAIICYELVFQTYSIKKHGKEWGNFDAFVVRSREASKRLKSLICLSDTWGTEVIKHYNFVSQYRTYCDELKVIARGINTWEDVVPKLNQSIDGRIRRNDGRARVKFSANPIERQDLTYVKNYVKTTEHRQLESPGLMPGYGLDKYGLIVREKFAAPLPVSPLPSASSQQQLNHDTIVSGNDPSQWEGSTLIPSSPPAKQMPLPSPSKSNEPTPPTPSQHDNSSASTTNVREQTTTPSTRSLSSLPGTSLSQSLPLSPATQLVVNGDVATGGNGRGGTHYTANGPIVAPSHPSPTSTSPLPSDVAASQSSPSSLSITRTSSEADTTTAICSSPLSPSPELSSTSSQRGPSKSAPASQNDDYSDVSMDWVERSGPPHRQHPRDNDSVATFAIITTVDIPIPTILPSGCRSRISLTIASPTSTRINATTPVIIREGSHHFLERFDPSMKWRFENGKCPLESELVLMPIHENSHWSLLVMYKRYFPATDHHERVVCFLDSRSSSAHSSSFHRWKTYLEAHGDRLPVQIKEVQVPQQTNTSDCGVFVLAFAETILQNVQGFIEAIDGGTELGWEFDNQTLRHHIKDNLTLAADAEELIGELAKLQARGSPLAVKLETLQYKEFLGGLELPLLQQKVKTPHDKVATCIEPSTSRYREDTSDNETKCDCDLPMVDSQKRWLGGAFSLKHKLPGEPRDTNKRQKPNVTNDTSHAVASTATAMECWLPTLPKIFSPLAGTPSHDDPFPLPTLSPDKSSNGLSLKDVTTCLSSLSQTPIPVIDGDLVWAAIFKRRNFEDPDAGFNPDQLGSNVFLDQNFVPLNRESNSGQSDTDMSRLSSHGFVQWQDESVGMRVDKMEDGDSFWTLDSMNILISVLADQRIRGILRAWFNGNCVIAHYTWWGEIATRRKPIFLACGSGSHIGYYTGSHCHDWPTTKDLWFKNTDENLNKYPISIEEKPNVVTFFNPLTNFQIQKGRTITVVFATRDMVKEWVPVRVRDAAVKEVFEKMEATTNVGWNFQYVGDENDGDEDY